MYEDFYHKPVNVYRGPYIHKNW